MVNQYIERDILLGRTEPLPKLREPHPDQGKKKRRPRVPKDKNPHLKRPPSLVTNGNFVSTKYADKDKHTIMLNSSDWIFTQVTALSSCPIDGYYIPAEYRIYINENGNAWSNEQLKRYYGTFIGGHNYYEHEQDPCMSYGFIVDAGLRPVGDVYYVDLLVATSTVKPPNQSVFNRICRNDIKTLSMGCQSEACQCSRCGKVFRNLETAVLCSHLNHQLGCDFVSKEGDTYTTAMIVTDGGVDGNIEFGEISWVNDPAFAGATSNYRISLPANQEIYFEFPKAALERANRDFAGAKWWLDQNLVTIKR